MEIMFYNKHKKNICSYLSYLTNVVRCSLSKMRQEEKLSGAVSSKSGHKTTVKPMKIESDYAFIIIF